MKKTLHASVALKEGAKLLLCVNPLVPYDADLAAGKSGGRPRPLAERGLVTVLSQTFRSLIYSRMRVGMDRYKADFPDADVVLFEPARDDEVIFFANIFSYGDRKQARRARLSPHARANSSAASTNSSRSSPVTGSRSTGLRSRAACRVRRRARGLARRVGYGIA